MKAPIMITAAMDEVELDQLKKELKSLQKKEGKIATFYEGTLGDYPIVLCHTKVGSLLAASAVTEGILNYYPRAIVTQGIAGAHASYIHVGDLVVSTEVIPIHSYQTPEKKKGEGSDSLSWKIQIFAEGQDEEEKIGIEADEKLLACAKTAQGKMKNQKVFFGRIGSGDVWNREVDRICYIQEHYQTLCEEMEGIAIFQIAQQYQIPVLDIRAISNHEVLKESYQREVGKKAQQFTLEVLKEYLKIE